MNSVLRYRLPRLEIRPRIDFPPVPGNEAEPRGEIPSPIEGLASSDGGHHGGGDQGANAGNAHQSPAISFELAEIFDFLGDRLDALIEPKPVLLKTHNQLAHAGRNLVAAVSQYLEERVAQCSGAGPHGDSLFDKKSADLVNRRRPARHQSGAHAMAGLQIKLILRLLADDAQVRPQGRLSDGFRVIVIVLLPLHERLDVDRRNDPRFMAERSQRPAHEMRAEAGFHANDAGRQFLECRHKVQTLDFSAKRNLSIGRKTDDMKNIFADVDANRCQDGRGALCFCFHGLLLLLLRGQVFADYPAGEAAGPSH
jgi:hypothetical protein